MSKAPGRADVVDAILGFLVETVYGPPEAAAIGLQQLTVVLHAVMLQAPLRLPGSDLSLWAIPEGLRPLPDGTMDWNLPAAEVCADLRLALDHLAEWKRGIAAEYGPTGVTIRQSGLAMPVKLRMSLGLDGTSPDRHFLSLQGASKDVFLALILLLLAHGSSAKVLSCPECHKVFFRANRRQTHCGKKCYDRQYWREKYTPHQKAKARRAQYKKNGWLLGAKGSPLGTEKPSTSVKSRRSSSSKRRGD